jgi:acetylornithine deacetylase
MDGLGVILDRIREDRLLHLLTDAVDVYSPSYAEAAATWVFTNALGRAGIPCRLEPVPAAMGDRSRANVVVQLGPDPAALLWVGHLDTVPLPDGSTAHGARRDGDTLFGLGTADMKSGCAAMAEALVAVSTAGIPLKRGLIVAFVVGEEEYGDGAMAFIQRNPLPPLTIIGEPTGLVPCTDHFGYLECLMTAEGIGAHAALPEIGRNAIQAMLTWLAASLERLGNLPAGDAIAINLRNIRGGGDKFEVPTRCEALLDVHLAPGGSAAEVLDRIGLARESVTSRRIRLDHKASFHAAGYSLDPASPLLSPMRSAYERTGEPWAPGAFRSHSDAALFREAGSSPILCGPGRLELAHVAHESVEIPEVVRAAKLYAAMIHEACIR